MNLVCIPQYTETQREARKRLIELIEFEQRAYLARIKPYQDQLVSIENCTPMKYIMVPE